MLKTHQRRNMWQMNQLARQAGVPVDGYWHQIAHNTLQGQPTTLRVGNTIGSVISEQTLQKAVDVTDADR